MNSYEFFGGKIRLTCNNPVDVGADPDHDPNAGILTEFLPLGIGPIFTNFRDLRAALAEVCAFRVFFLYLTTA